jgi:hypothetical protein
MTGSEQLYLGIVIFGFIVFGAFVFRANKVSEDHRKSS